MRHPNEATLALHAGGDLGAMARWRTQRHLAKCARCRQELAAFTATRDAVNGLAGIPELPWNLLEAEMKANIRLGLAAGECVRGRSAAHRNGWHTPAWLTGARAAVACAGVVVLLATALLVEHAGPHSVAPRGVVVENMADGIQMTDGGQSLGLMNTGAQSVIYSVSSQGMQARYVDPKTGLVTVNNLDLYAQSQ